MREVKIEGRCPFCGGGGLVMRSLPLDIPYFGEALQTTVLCPDCSFRHADLMLTREGPPARHELRVSDPADLAARVVRSAASTIRVPELGAIVEPGLRADAFVSNAEGVLRRVRDIADFGRRTSETDAARRKADAVVARIDGMIAGREPFTLVLEDPTGNSAIVHERATRTELTAAEARRLKQGVPEFRVSR
jgi:zinc finger protein